MAAKTIEEATELKQVTSHTYEANFPDEWCIGSVPQGGFITSVFLRVASLHSTTTLSSQNQPHVIALHLDFLRRTQTGPALFTIQDIKLGRQASVLSITLSQSSRTEVIGSISLSNIPLETGPSFPTTFTPSPTPPPCNFALLAKDQDPNWIKSPFNPYSEFRKARQRIEFYYPRAGQHSRTSAYEYIRLSSPTSRWTNYSLGFAADMWPMPVEASSFPFNPYDPITWSPSSPEYQANKSGSGAKLWYPTLLLNMEIKKALPEEGLEWLMVRTETKVIKNGRMDIDVVIMDAKGEVLALSNHVGFAVSAERNVAKRREGNGEGESSKL